MVSVRIPVRPSSQRLKTLPGALEGRFGQAGGTLVMKFGGCGQVEAGVGPYASALDLGLLPAAAGAWR
jgi:hypothetical protein